MRLALLIVPLLLLPIPAQAAPVVVAIALWAGVSTAVVYAAIVMIAIGVGTAVYGSAQARRAERDAKDQANAGMRDRMATRVAIESPHRYIYGRARVGADIVAMFTSGDKDQFKHIVCVHAAHECDAIEEIYVNNVPVGPVNADGDVTTGRHATAPGRDILEEIYQGPTFQISRPPVAGSVRAYIGNGAGMTEVAVTSVSARTVTVAVSGAVLVSYEIRTAIRFNALIEAAFFPTYAPVVRVRLHLGGANAVVDSYLASVLGAKWPATAILKGMCYTVITLDLNHAEFQNGLVPIHAMIRGKKLYDPRTGLTVWSANPALAIYDYLTSPLCGVAPADLPIDQFITAANVCDEAVVAGGRYTINGTVNSDQSQSSILEAMAQCMAGGIVATTWDVSAGKYIAPVAALTQADIVGSISITPSVSDAAMYNGVKGQFISPENKYILTDFKPYQNVAFRAADGRDLFTNIDFPFTDSLQRVTNLARIFTEDQRNGFTLKAEFSLKAWPLKVGQRLAFTSEFLGQTAKIYRITDKSYAPNSAVQLTLKEDAPGIWDLADQVVADATPNSDMPEPWDIADLAMISCTSGESTLLRQTDGSMVPRIRVTWPAATTQAVFTNGQIEIEWRAVSSTTWEKAIVSGSETQAYLSPITPGYFYHVRARCVNPYLNTKSGWIFTTYQVQVFAARPVVYKWAETMPAAPAGVASFVWATQSFGAAPAGWSLTAPAKPVTGPDVTLFTASVLVSDISPAGAAPFDWSTARVAAVGYAAAAALAAAAAAQQTANSASSQAALAIADITNIASDNVLSRSEKSELILKYGAVNAEFADIFDRATAAGVSNAAYLNSKSSLNTYLVGLSPAWNDTTTNTSIVGATFRAMLTDYYTARQALLNLLSADAATKANWTVIAGRPTDAELLNSAIVVGGRNLVKNSNNYALFNYLNGSIAATGQPDNAGDLLATIVNLTATSWDMYRTVTNLIPGRSYSASLWVEMVSASNFVLSVNNTLTWDTGPSKVTTGAGWQRVSVVFTATQIAANIHLGAHSQSGVAAQTAGQVRLTPLQVEDGNAATQWSPAPEDVAADATAKADAAAVLAVNAAAIASQTKANLAETKAKAYADGIVTAEEDRAIADATTKANNAQAAAVAAAALDATAKANAAVFSPKLMLEFKGTLDGAGPSGCTISAGTDSLTVTSTSIDPVFFFVGLMLSGVYDKIRMRLRRLAGAGWEGNIYYATAGHAWSGAFSKIMPDTTSAAYSIIEWDMAALTSGGADWVSNTITGIRFDLGTTAADVFEIDWISVGKLAPPTIADLGFTGDLSATHGANLLQNGSFESGLSGWALKHSGNSGAAHEVITVTDAYSGSKVLELTGANTVCDVSRAAAVVPGKTYRVRFKYRALTASVESYWYYGVSGTPPSDGYNGYPPAAADGNWLPLPNATPGAMVPVGLAWSTYDQLLTIPEGRYWLSLALHRWAASGVGARLQVGLVAITEFTGDMNATAGAPAGTLVAGVDAATVATGAANGTAALAPLAASIGGLYDVTSLGNANTSAYILVDTQTAVPAGGVAPYTLSYIMTASGSIRIRSVVGATVSVEARGSNIETYGDLTCTAVDARGRSFFLITAYTVGFGSGVPA